MKRAPEIAEGGTPYQVIRGVTSQIPQGPWIIPTDQATDEELLTGWSGTVIVSDALPQMYPLTAWVDQDQQSRGLSQKVVALQREIETLKESLGQLAGAYCLRIPVSTLAPERYEVIRPFEAVIELGAGEYIASFFDAGISASGETSMEAFANLKDMVIGVFGLLLGMDERQCGPEPQRQLAVLQQFIREV
jgi:predicted RNase H-like HicB family nuclease